MLHPTVQLHVNFLTKGFFTWNKGDWSCWKYRESTKQCASAEVDFMKSTLSVGQKCYNIAEFWGCSAAQNVIMAFSCVAKRQAVSELHIGKIIASLLSLPRTASISQGKITMILNYHEVVLATASEDEAGLCFHSKRTHNSA